MNNLEGVVMLTTGLFLMLMKPLYVRCVTGRGLKRYSAAMNCRLTMRPLANLSR